MPLMPKTWAHPKTLAEWRIKVLDTLGGIAWNIELTERHLDHALHETLMLYNKYRPVVKWRPLGEIVGDAQFDFNDEEIGVRVKDVKFKRQELYFTPQAYPQYSIHYGFMNMRSSRLTHEALVADDRYRSFLGVQPDWAWDEERRILVIKSVGSLTPVLASALILTPNRIENISFDQEYDFLKCAVGHAKIILARILGKFGDIPGAQGNITLDADTLRQEGNEEVSKYEALWDRNVKRVPPRPIFG